MRKGLKINEKNHLVIAGNDCVDLKEKYNTPLYVMDMEYIENMCDEYVSAMKECYGNGRVVFASKAFCCKAMVKTAIKHGMGLDIVSGGELYTAVSCGADPSLFIFHGNNKLQKELNDIVKYKVGLTVLDSLSEALELDEMCKNADITLDCLIRINPGVDAHTHSYIQTAKPDSKFGFGVFNNEAMKMTESVLKLKNLKLKGFHSHIGSQIFELNAFTKAVGIITDFMKEIKTKLNFETEILNLGGGFGIVYTEDDKPKTPYEYIKALTDALKTNVKDKDLKAPMLIVEPGRSVVGEGGITLYSVGRVKEIPQLRNYIAIDGGMFDNPRFALYQAKYACDMANRMNAEKNYKATIAGKCCESGDLIIVDALLPKPEKGDIIAVYSTGAYNYSMASNYNRNPIPPVVWVKDGKSGYMIKPQTYEDIAARDCDIEI